MLWWGLAKNVANSQRNPPSKSRNAEVNENVFLAGGDAIFLEISTTSSLAVELLNMGIGLKVPVAQ